MAASFPARIRGGRKHFWFTVMPREQTEPGTDLWAMERGYISITPLSLNLTDQPDLARLATALPLDAPPIEERAEEMEEDESS